MRRHILVILVRTPSCLTPEGLTSRSIHLTRTQTQLGVLLKLANKNPPRPLASTALSPNFIELPYRLALASIHNSALGSYKFVVYWYLRLCVGYYSSMSEDFISQAIGRWDTFGYRP